MSYWTSSFRTLSQRLRTFLIQWMAAPFWWIVDRANWNWKDEQLNVVFPSVHPWTCWTLLAVITVHVGALFHGFLWDAVIRRMLHLRL